MYNKDGYCYLMLAQGGTTENYMVTVARSEDIKGPYESHENNSILTDKGTGECFQAVGHVDLF